MCCSWPPSTPFLPPSHFPLGTAQWQRRSTLGGVSAAARSLRMNNSLLLHLTFSSSPVIPQICCCRTMCPTVAECGLRLHCLCSAPPVLYVVPGGVPWGCGAVFLITADPTLSPRNIRLHVLIMLTHVISEWVMIITYHESWTLQTSQAEVHILSPVCGLKEKNSVDHTELKHFSNLNQELHTDVRLQNQNLLQWLS